MPPAPPLGVGGKGDGLLPSLETGSAAQRAFNPDATMRRCRADRTMVDAAFQGARRGHTSTSGIRSDA
jgi:hypothetical protein